MSPPSLTKSFGAASIPLNGTTSLSFGVANPNATQGLSGVGFTDTLPAGLVVSTPTGLTGSCGGGTIATVAGAGTISLSGATLNPSASCTFSVNVTGITAGTKNNTTSGVTSTEGGTGQPASASLDVVAPPSIAKAFNPSTIAPNGTTSLTFTITNPAQNADQLNGVAFTDPLPAGLTVANASATVCGGTLTTTSPVSISLTGATIAVNSQCQFSVTVTGAASGSYTNISGAVTSTNGGTGNTASANLAVGTPPTIQKSFTPSSTVLQGTSALRFTIHNPSPSTQSTGVGFTDNLPSGLVVATPNGLTGSCGGGMVTATAGAGTISLSGATLPANGSCRFSVKITATSAGTKHNSVTVTSDQGTGNTASASLGVIGCGPGLVARTLTAHTNVGTIQGLFCSNRSTSTGTYTQAPFGSHGIVSGQGAVAIAHGVTAISAKGTNLALAGTINGATNIFIETAPVAAKGTFTLG